jgi:threonine dehydrogenase-like Zn-dependent dehydrogenase
MQALVYKINPVGWATCKWMRFLWPGCRMGRLNGFSLRNIPEPDPPGPDWVRVKTRLGGICGSDIALVLQKQPANSMLQSFCSVPMVLGHENVGEVDGRRVVVEPTLSCVVRGTDPMCPRCEAGEYGACENFSGAMGGSANLPAGTSIGYNARTGGSWGEYFVAHKSQLLFVDDLVTDEQAIMIDPMACSLHALLRADLEGVQSVLVYGAGVLGLGTIGCLRALGYRGRIEVVDLCDYMSDQVSRLGADDFFIPAAGNRERFEEIASRTGSTLQRARFGNYMLSGGYDMLVDCVGTARSVNDVLRWTRARGQVIMLGTLQSASVDLTPLWFRELKIIGTYGRQLEHFEGGRVNTYGIVHDWMVSGKLSADGLLTHLFPLREYKKAFRAAIYKPASKSIKVAFDMR